jgi:hypothetical protein
VDSLIDHLDEVGTEFIIARAADEGVLTESLVAALATEDEG